MVSTVGYLLIPFAPVAFPSALFWQQTRSLTDARCFRNLPRVSLSCPVLPPFLITSVDRVSHPNSQAISFICIATRVASPPKSFGTSRLTLLPNFSSFDPYQFLQHSSIQIMTAMLSWSVLLSSFAKMVGSSPTSISPMLRTATPSLAPLGLLLVFTPTLNAVAHHWSLKHPLHIYLSVLVTTYGHPSIAPRWQSLIPRMTHLSITTLSITLAFPHYLLRSQCKHSLPPSLVTLMSCITFTSPTIIYCL